MVSHRNVHPITVMQVQDCCGRNGRALLVLSSVESCGREHARAHQPWVAYFDANLCGPDIRVKDKANVADSSGQYSVRIGIQANIGLLPKAYIGESFSYTS